MITIQDLITEQNKLAAESTVRDDEEWCDNCGCYHLTQPKQRVLIELSNAIH